WLRLIGGGRAGHGSMLHDDNAVTALCEAIARVGRHRFPIELTPTVRALLERISELLGLEFDPDDPDAMVGKLGPVAAFIGATMRNTANPTRLAAGDKENVVPSRARAPIDRRPRPGRADEFRAQLRELIGPDIEIEPIHQQTALETTFDGPLVDAMAAALRAADPGARALPYML